MHKKKGYTKKRLAELERQVRKYSDDDLLDEASKLEQEMGRQEKTSILPNDFFEQMLAKAKGVEQNGKKFKMTTELFMRISWVVVRLGKSSFFITVGGTSK